jgi:hypothetical protein
MNEIILAPCDVISKIKQNSSDMNKIILAPCDFISKIKQNSSDMNEIILASCDAGYVQNCTGFSLYWQCKLFHLRQFAAYNVEIIGILGKRL